MLNVGIVGIGFMGMIHYLAYQQVRGARVAAICSREEKKLAGDWTSIKGNFGPAGAKMDLRSVTRYGTIEELLADPKIDLVDICLPPALHADATVAALRAGKHVLCEKPIALTTAEATRMTRAAAQSGKQLMIAHVLPFMPEYAYALKAIQSGRYGALWGGHFKRIISDPLWLKDFYDPRVVGGPVIDLHIHDAHFIRMIAGMPRSVSSVGRLHGGDGVVEFLSTQFIYDDPAPVITATSGVLRQQGRPFTHAFEIYLEQATLLFDFAALATGGQGIPLTILLSNGKVQQPVLSAGDPVEGFVHELKEVCRCVERGTPSAILDGSIARDSLLLCEREIRSVQTKKPVRL